MLLSAHTSFARLLTFVLSISLMLPDSFWLILTPLKAGKSVQQPDRGVGTTGPALPDLPNIDDVKRDKHKSEKMNIPASAKKPAPKCRLRDARCQSLLEQKKVSSLLSPTPQENRQMIASAADVGSSQGRTLKRDWLSELLPPLPGFIREAGRSVTDAVIGRPGTLKATTAPIAAPAAPPPPSWPTDYYSARMDRRNRVGGAGEDLLSGNYHWSLPLVSLPGRAGLDLTLALHYNSKVWIRMSNEMVFDPDYGWPTPGFRLGFPALEGSYWAGGQNRYLLLLPSGHKVELFPNGSQVWEAFDGSFIQMKMNDPQSGWATVRMTDGTQLKYNLTDTTAPDQCKEIRDRYGNYLTITYNNYWTISTIKDTLGRLITFDYGTVNNNYNMPLRIKQTWNGQEYVWAEFFYAPQPLTIQTNFPGLTNYAQGASTPVLSGVKLTDGSYYTFEYTSYAQVRAIRYRPVGASCDRSGIIYNLPNVNTTAPPPEPGCFAPEAADLGTNTAQSDCPVFTKRTDYAVWWGKFATEFVTGPATSWSYGQVRTPVTTGSPNGTYYREWYLDSSQGQRAYLTRQSEYYDTTPPAGDNGPALKKTTVIWQTPSATGFGNPRPLWVDVTDNNNNLRSMVYTYTSYNLPTWIEEYGGTTTSAPLLRKTQTQYRLTADYTNRRIIGLPEWIKLFDANNALASYVENVYDDYTTVPMTNLPVGPTQVEQFSAAYFPPGAVQALGNVTQTKRYDVTNPGSFVQTKTSYYATGQVAAVTSPMDKTSYVSYNDSFIGNVGGTPGKSKLAYPTTLTDPDSFASTIQYEYDTGFVRQTTDPRGGVVTRIYDTVGRIQKITNQGNDADASNDASTEYSYPFDNSYVTTYTTLADANLANRFFSLTLLDGFGRSTATLQDHPGSAGGYRLQYTLRDSVGQVSNVSNPTEVNASWDNNVTGGDDTGSIWWSGQTYDWKGRPRVHTNQSGITSQITYGGCGCAGAAIPDEAGNATIARFTRQSFCALICCGSCDP
jgi:hypothetical protein